MKTILKQFHNQMTESCDPFEPMGIYILILLTMLGLGSCVLGLIEGCITCIS
jgi:hypothetical protein